jgi:Rhs element Vgr protein
MKAVNRLAWARLAYVDGAASTADFPLGNTDTFVPGAKVEIEAGTGDDPVPVFSGIVLRHGVRVRDTAAPQLIVDCRHPAAKLAVGRKNACYFDQKDSDVIEDLLSRAGISMDIEATSVAHPQLVQYRATDWDFLLARAEANGRLVLTNDDTVVVKKPDLGSDPVCQLQFGATILELDAEIDARRQWAGVSTVSWDPAQQDVVETDADTPSLDAPGNFTADDLADVSGLEKQRLVHAAVSAEEAKAWADAEWLKARLSKLTGRAKCEGIATISPGDRVTLGGVGERINGDVFVTGVRHDFDTVQGWKTHVQFGGVDGWATAGPDVSAPPAGALSPAVSGLQIGTVVSNEDEAGEHRVRVRLPLVDTREEGIWARVAALDAGNERGFFIRPEIGDEVVVGFLDDDPRQPVMLGMLHSSANAPHLSGSDDNHEKGYQSRSKMRLSFHDDDKVMSLETPAGNKIELSEKDKTLTITDQTGNSITMNPDGITIESKKALALKAGTELTLESGTSLKAKGGTDLKLEGTSAAELSSTGSTKVSGSVVQIN